MGDDAWQTELEAECGKAVPRPEKVREVCRELRARDAFPKHAKHPPSDPPIIDGGAA